MTTTTLYWETTTHWPGNQYCHWDANYQQLTCQQFSKLWICKHRHTFQTTINYLGSSCILIPAHVYRPTYPMNFVDWFGVGKFSDEHSTYRIRWPPVCPGHYRLMLSHTHVHSCHQPHYPGSAHKVEIKIFWWQSQPSVGAKRALYHQTSKWPLLSVDV